MIDVANGGSRTLGAILKQSDRSWFFKLTGESALVGAQKEMFVAFLKSVDFPAEGAAGPGAASRRMASTNDLPPAARGMAAGPLAESALPPGHPPIDNSTMPAAAGAGMAATPVPTASGPALTWTAPASWKTKTGSAMRRGSYAVPGPEGEGDLSITAFPGDVGGDLANINRWRGQVGLPPVADVAGGAQTIEAGTLKMLLVDAANNGNRILGTIVSRPGETWFFKLAGPDALVAREKPAFVAFLQTVKAP
ncbi:MAG: hypothetical protein A3G75_13035 [Verrucomicrobia bacterium RIFCSPLOWO2_12_FULL_64_8]|nr:MAG: hypothetical protein A3G75_13035 [Verrucomicrobia bacterium RIFCSPLOWO2_12_FULL_64_8]